MLGAAAAPLQPPALMLQCNLCMNALHPLRPAAQPLTYCRHKCPALIEIFAIGGGGICGHVPRCVGLGCFSPAYPAFAAGGDS